MLVPRIPHSVLFIFYILCPKAEQHSFVHKSYAHCNKTIFAAINANIVILCCIGVLCMEQIHWNDSRDQISGDEDRHQGEENKIT